MAQKGGRPPKMTAPSEFDIALDPLLRVGKGRQQRYVSAAYILLHGQFRNALEGKPSGVAAMLKIMKINARERERQPGPSGPWDQANVYYGKPIIDARPALQILHLASKYRADSGASAFGIEPWVIALAEERAGLAPYDGRWWTSPHVRPEHAASTGAYCIADDPRFAPPPPKRPAGSTRFQPGQSGNKRGRPVRHVAAALPFDGFLNEPLTMMIEGEPFEGTRLLAMIHQANLRAIKDDDKLAKLLNAAYVEEHYARWKRAACRGMIFRDVDEFLARDPFHAFLIKLDLINRRLVRRAMLMPWIVQAALGRLTDLRLTPQEQAAVVQSTSTPEKVVWPEWWEIRTAPKPRRP